MNYSLSLKLIDKPNAKGLKPVKVKITLSGQVPIYKTTGVRLLPPDWNKAKESVKTSHPNHILFNNKISAKKNEIEGVLLNLQLSGRLSRQNLKDALETGATVNFTSYIERLTEELRAKRSKGRISIYYVEQRRLKRFSSVISFSDINHSWLRKYEAFIKSEVNENNTVVKAWKVLEFFLNSAVREGIINENPTKNYDRPKYIQTERVFLIWDEVLELEKLLDKPLPVPMRKTLLFYLLGCYTGLRISDWYKYSPGRIMGDRFILQATKNNRFVSLKITPSLQRILDLIGKERLTIHLKELRSYLKALGVMAGIDKDITPHSSRHSFSVRCLSKKIPTYRIAQWLGVNEKTVKVYSHLIDTEGDEDIEIAFG